MRVNREGTGSLERWFPCRGITLVELVVVLAILSLLLLAALPSYSRYVQRTYRTEAVEALLNEATRQERNYLVKRRFVSRPSYEGASGHYRISVELTDSGSGYLLRALPIGSQAADTCGTFELDNQGRKRSGGDTRLCWTGRG
jgi:type IV pilus assembly protein PilE